MTDYLEHLSEDDLARLNLARTTGGYEIRWPEDANIYHMTLGRHLGPGDRDRTAIVCEYPDGSIIRQTFAEVEAASTGLAAGLRALGYGKGDKIAVHTGQHPDTAIAHMAVCKLGAVAVTLSQMYGPETLAHAMRDSGARVILTADPAWSRLRDEAPALFPDLEHVIVRNPAGGEIDLAAMMAKAAPGFEPDFGGADDPALLMYTSGSTGKPKGILHGHRILAAYTPTINLFFNLSMDVEDAVFYSPSDWAWVGGLLDMLFPAWMAGRTVATCFHRFRPDIIYPYLARHKITHAFLAPTALKRLATVAKPRDEFDLALQVVCTGGEALASDTLEWAERQLGVVCNEFYGMTEVNHLIGNCAALFPRKAGSMGRAYPGHDVRLIDGDGVEVAPGQPGEVMTLSTSPTRFLGYFNNPEKAAEMEFQGFLRTGDLAVKDEEGYFWYKGRSDDLIKSSGFRIGPTEIEDCLLGHDAVVEAGVIGKPDPDPGGDH